MIYLHPQLLARQPVMEVVDWAMKLGYGISNHVRSDGKSFLILKPMSDAERKYLNLLRGKKHG